MKSLGPSLRGSICWSKRVRNIKGAATGLATHKFIWKMAGYTEIVTKVWEKYKNLNLSNNKY